MIQAFDSVIIKLAIDHEIDQFIYVFFFVSKNFQFRNLTVGENVCQRNILAQLRLQIQSVTFACY